MSQLIACPECSKDLQVPDKLIGKKVQCPQCKHAFTAAAPEPDEIAPKTATTASKPVPPKTAAWDKKAKAEKDDDEERPTRKKKRRADEDEEDDDDEDRPRRSRRSSRRDYVPHRGGMILAFGIIGLVALPIFGIIAWIMGNSDLAEIRAGRMDPEGEGMTSTGRILGMVGVILWVVGIIVFCGGYFFCIALFVGAGAAAAKNNPGFRPPMPPPQKF